jgi:predicted nucleic acid-binding protein
MARYTVDASVFLNAFNPAEPGHATSNRFLDQLRQSGVPIIVPSLIFPEIAATISRTRGDARLARRFADAVWRWPNLVRVALDDALSMEATHVAARHKLRGSDAVYVAVAQRFATVLVTLDREQRERGRAAITALNPEEALTPGI